MRISLLASFLIATFAISACAAKPNQVPISSPTDSSTMTGANTSENLISGTGTIRFQEIEGGFWGIVADDGNKFDPMNLDVKFQKDGLRVRFKAMPDPDIMSTHMWGTIVNITQIEKIK